MKMVILISVSGGGVGLFTYFQMEFHNAEHTILYITMILMNPYGDRTEFRHFLGEPHVFVLTAKYYAADGKVLCRRRQSLEILCRQRQSLKSQKCAARPETDDLWCMW